MTMAERTAFAAARGRDCKPIAQIEACILTDECGCAGSARATIEALREPSEAMMAAANALPVSKQVNGMISFMTLRAGTDTGLPGAPNTPLQQWWRAMIDCALTGRAYLKEQPIEVEVKTVRASRDQSPE
jgi:hypothetical protein